MHGEGLIVFVQLRLTHKRERAPPIFLENLINFTCGDRKDKPLLVLDEGGSVDSSRNTTLAMLLGLDVFHVLCDN